MRRVRPILAALVALFALALALPAQAAQSPYRTGFARWRAETGFAGWALAGVVPGPGGVLAYDAATAATENDTYPVGGYYGGNYYTGGSYRVGEALSPVVSSSFGFSEAIASWNVDAPPGSWSETQIRAQAGGRWTKWYNLGIWAADNSTVERHSVRLQGDADGFVAVDTLVLSDKKTPATAFQVKVRLFSTGGAQPALRNLSVAYSTAAPKSATLSAGDPGRWGTLIDLPECSQMVYPDGGEVWCSPTSTSMVLAYWLTDTRPCEPRVRAAVDGVYDWIYDGHGNWPFNTAYAATLGLEGYVARFTGLDEVEKWVAAGVPVVFSFAWGKNDLDGAAIPSSAGHLAVLVGFDASGNPIVNDPAAASDAEVRRTYDRAQLEALWLESSGGTVYLIYPPGTDVPQL